MAKLIVLEGIDGVGKTEQASRLYKYLLQEGYDTILEKEPTDGYYGRKLKKLFQQKQRDPEKERQLFIQDRKEHVKLTIRPLLEQDKWIVLDRYYYSTMAYQGAMGFSMEQIRDENEQFAPKPDIVLFLDMDVETALTRIAIRTQQAKSKPHPFEEKEYLNQVRQGFLRIQRDNPNRVFTIEAKLSIIQVHESILDCLKTHSVIG